MRYIVALIGLSIFLVGFLLIVIAAHTPFDTATQKDTVLTMAGIIGISGCFIATFAAFGREFVSAPARQITLRREQR